jgi:hypothetical protein
LIAQNLLYVSLFSTLLAALLAVLGKQWLMYYLAAGERGTLETRGLERQRKFDGLRRWKFDTVMEMFPLLLQIGLFLFSTALSIYLWTVHISLAIVVLSFTSFGFVSYTALLVSAVAAPDSPFQTPLAPLVTQLIPKTLWAKLKSFSRLVLERPLRRLAEAYMPKSRDLLPLSLRGQFAEKNGCAPDQPTTVFNAAFPEPSPEVPAVLWVLENSTDPHMMALAAEMVIHLQWPCTMDARQYLTRLHDGLLACFSLYHTENGPLLIRNLDGMADQAIHLGQAYCALRWVLLARQSNPQNFRYGLPGMNRCRPELINVVCNLAGEPAVMCDSDLGLATKWALHVIPSISYRDSESKRRLLEYFLDQFNDALPTLDSHSFADYLFCIYSFLSDINPCDIGWMDKRCEEVCNP